MRTKFDYDVHVRPPDVPKGDFINGHLGTLDHERALYYIYLERRHLFNTTIAQLDAPQLELVKDEESRILTEALIKARALAAESKAAANAVAEADARDRRKGLWDNADSEEVQRKFADLKRIDSVSGIASAVPVVPTQAAPVRGVARMSFMRILPSVKEFAEASCRLPGQVLIPETITQPPEAIIFGGTGDDQEIDRLAAGLGTCEGRLFRRLSDVIREGKGPAITDQWMQETAKFYSTPPAARNNRTTSTPPVREPPSNPGCSVENGVMGCPQ